MSWRDMTELNHSICIGTFGDSDTVEFKPEGGDFAEVGGIFDRTYIGIDPDTGAEVSSNQPMVFVQMSKLPKEPDEGDEFRINGEVFTIYDTQEDGQGGMTVFLHSE